ncbi:glycoside hydrolase family 2 protein [Paenibacillus ginsengarvi]|uniref:Glycoside hydrolase family 2 n=1 Tax=Paenibacillus ginsengarvi TaxID=400777 RepID=A0A3B0C6C6_9BACL|nr:sugar-binding domain-containing protein [Paenibacillus ginsengarvi]RKN80700.1 glycoside hydrolase family 2 [Paenibacillus ginsengarvi]
MSSPSIPRAEYPRPQFERDDWLTLNGSWEFEYDDGDEGETQRWYASGKPAFTKTIVVPYCFQSKLSGIGDPSIHDVVWYRRNVNIPASFLGKRILLHFGAVDYEAKVWVNGQLVASHEGGHTPFQADITDALDSGGSARIVVRAQDYSRDMALPRGKQYWKDRSEGIFYTRTTGIWQPVWLEAVSGIHLRQVRLTPDIDRERIDMRFHIALPFANGGGAPDSLVVKTTVTFAGDIVAEDSFSIRGETEFRSIGLSSSGPGSGGARSRWWSPESPKLFEVAYTLEQNGQPLDHVRSYFGMRKVSMENGKLYLNNSPYYMKLVLDQGYFPDSLLTPPTDEAIRYDVEATKAMGFNGARKHQKIEDPRYLYWCDKLGLLLWGEMANAYIFTETYASRMTKEWIEAVERDYNHPCVVAWVPLNESWGVPNISVDKQQQNHAQALYYLTKSLDATRPVVSNDGWEHAVTDLCTIHDYAWKREVLAQRYASAETAVTAEPARRRIFASGFRYEGQPILVTEFGGIAFKQAGQEGWGYSGAQDEADFVKRLADVVHPLLQSPVVRGFCYTQLTDVEQEVNGLMTYDRKPKLPFEVIKKINQGLLPDYPAKD